MNLKFPKRSSETEWIEFKVFEVEIDRVESKVFEKIGKIFKNRMNLKFSKRSSETE